MPVVITADEYLVINSVTLATPAWRITDLTDLYDEAEIRGDDVLIPHSAGVVAKQRRRTVTRKALPITVFGESDQNGSAYGNARDGLAANVAYLMTNVVAPTGASDGTRAAVWHLRDGSTKSANVHVLAPLGLTRISPTTMAGVLRLSIPTGRFT